MSATRFSRHAIAIVSLSLLSLGPACAAARRPMEPPKELPKGTHYHALPQTQLGLYAVFLPPDYDAVANHDKTYPLVLILHGHGSTEIRHGQLAEKFGRKEAIYLAPRAPYPHEGVFIGLHTPGWTAMPTVPEQLATIEEGHPDYVDIDRLYTDWIAATLQDARRRYRVSEQRAVVYGHSQGAWFAHLFALHHPELVRAYYAFAGWYGDANEIGAGVAARFKEYRIFPFLSHNRPDPVMKVEGTETLVEYFKRNGVPHGTFLSEEGDHYLTTEGERSAADFIHDWCSGAHKEDSRRFPSRPLPEDRVEVEASASSTTADD